MVFSIPSFTTVGDDYDAPNKRVLDARLRGRCFAVPGPKSGHGPDATFTKEFQSIHQGDPFVDPGTREKRERVEKEKKKITSTGFRLTNPSPKGCGLGSYFGTFGTPWPHETSYVVPRKGEKPPKLQHEQRNMVTNPSKKGSYGVAGTLLSNLGVEYVADFYEGRREREKQELEEHKKKMKGSAFKAACRLGGTFDEAMGTGISKCYTMTKRQPPKKQLKQFVGLKGPEAPWKPSGPLLTGALGSTVEYREDPYDGYDPRAGRKKVGKRGDSGKAEWKPGGATSSSWYTKSIAFGRL